MIDRDLALRTLVDLVGIDSVNPMGGRFEASAPVERGVTEYVEKFFAPFGVSIEREQVSDRHESLLVTIPGASNDDAILFEAHADTVPADDWGPAALQPVVQGSVVIGRGASDCKGSMTAMMLAVADLLETGTTPPRQIVLMAAGDEEYAQTGIKRWRDRNTPVSRAIIGEPTANAPLVQHKGTIRWDITVHGRSAHTSRPELGVNAIHGAIVVIDALAKLQDDLQRRYTSPLMTGPTLTVTMINGGRTRNAVPDRCTIAVDFRVVPGMVPEAARDEVVATVGALGLEVTHGDVQLMTPPLATEPADPFSIAVLEACRRHAGAGIELAGAPYGTDASWLSDRAPALVLGPGSIDSAHAIGEQVDIDDVVTCARIYRDIMLEA